MRIVVSDYSGHAFPVELARALSARGHTVLHLSAASFQTPKGKLERDLDDPETLAIITVTTRAPFAKDSFLRRRLQEIELGNKMAEQIVLFRPDIVLSGNAPLDTQQAIHKAARKTGAGFIFWVQDLYGEAIRRILQDKLGIVGRVIGQYFQRMESRLLRAADHIIVISKDFIGTLPAAARHDPARISVIENWAPIADIPQLLRDNAWARANLDEAAFRIAYSGTLGFKHNPELLAAAARDIDADVLVFSEGQAATSLAARSATQRNLKVQGWLPFADLPAALASADILTVILEKDAGVFSVPSKVLTYLSVGRPIVAAVPAHNLAARIITEYNAGLVCEPDDEDGFVAAMRTLRADPALRRTMGGNARAYAEATFSIDRIVAAFETIFHKIQGTTGR
jgi:colanic acid biosynthesis glycosyl transferase WcaI